MTRDYGKVRAQFWDDDALRELSIEANYLALYLITSSHTNAIGCFRLPIAYILNDTRLDKKSLEKALAELRSTCYAIPCERVPWIYIPNFLRHNPPENPNVWRKCVKELESLPAGISAIPAIAAELIAIAGEDRMSRKDSKTRVSEEEITRLERYRNGIETVSDGLTPLSSSLPIPFPNQTISKPADAKVLVVDPEFEEFWLRFKPPPNASKPDARKAWGQVAGTRPVQSELLRAVDGYNAWLAEETRKRKSEYPKQHAATWLRNEVWGGFMDSGARASPEELAAILDKRDRLLRQGKYAHRETVQ